MNHAQFCEIRTQFTETFHWRIQAKKIPGPDGVLLTPRQRPGSLTFLYFANTDVSPK